MSFSRSSLTISSLTILTLILLMGSDPLHATRFIRSSLHTSYQLQGVDASGNLSWELAQSAQTVDVSLNKNTKRIRLHINGLVPNLSKQKIRTSSQINFGYQLGQSTSHASKDLVIDDFVPLSLSAKYLITASGKAELTLVGQLTTEQFQIISRDLDPKSSR